MKMILELDTREDSFEIHKIRVANTNYRYIEELFSLLRSLDKYQMTQNNMVLSELCKSEKVQSFVCELRSHLLTEYEDMKADTPEMIA